MLGQGRQERWPLPALPILRDGILISICALDQVTILRIDSFDTPLMGLDIEEAALAYLHPSDMDARGLERGRDNCSDEVARLEPPAPACAASDTHVGTRTYPSSCGNGALDLLPRWSAF